MLCHQFSICFNKEFRQHQQQQQQQQERAKVPGKKCCTTLLPAMGCTHNNDTAMSRLPQAQHSYPRCPTLRLDSLSEKLQVCQKCLLRVNGRQREHISPRALLQIMRRPASQPCPLLAPFSPLSIPLSLCPLFLCLFLSPLFALLKASRRFHLLQVFRIQSLEVLCAQVSVCVSV